MAAKIDRIKFSFLLALVFLISLAGCGRSRINTFFAAGAANDVAPLACDTLLTSSYGGGAGTSVNPYAICSVSQWKVLGSDSANWDKYFKLYADLDFTGVTTADFLPIGNGTTAFTGHLDGNNFKLMNLNLSGTTQNTAFFLKTNSPASFSNISLKNITVRSTTATVRVGGFIIDHGSGGVLSLTNIAVDTLNLSNTLNSDNVGGLIGASASPVTIVGATLNNFTLNGALSSSHKLGGVIGYSALAVSISNLTAANLTISSNSYYKAGGLVGEIFAGGGAFTDITITGLTGLASAGFAGVVYDTDGTTTFTRVRVSGTVNGGNDAGGLISYNNGSVSPSIVIADSSFTGTVNGSYWAGGLVGLNYDGDVSITRSFAKASMAIWNGTGGGLLGQMQGTTSVITITDSYAVSNLSNGTSNYIVSGLLGTAEGHVSITRAYTAGNLTGSALRACIGQTAGAVSYLTTDSYYDSTLCTASADVSGSIAGATGLVTASIQTATAFTNWSPTVWSFASGQNPKLIWEP